MSANSKENKFVENRTENGGGGKPKPFHKSGSLCKGPTLIITGYPRTVKRAAFQKFLASFGKVHKCYFYRDYTTIQYATENTYKTLLQSPLRYENNFLKIKIASPSEIPKNKNENDLTKNLNNGMNIIDPLQLVNKLTECKTADEQLMYFMKELQLPYQEIKTNYSALCQHLELALNTSLFKGCRAMPFGSTVTGLAFKWSDLDVFIQISNISNNLTNATTLAAMYVNESRKPLQRRSDLFTKIITITKAKTPIVKCIHKPTGINCDINFKNMLGVCNSSLVNFLLNSDVRLRPMMMVIKYWAKINDITGPGKISNYALVMLLIFYLQQNPKPILPNISMLQHPSFDKIIEGWNAGYNHNFYFHTINEDSIPYLLHGFYEFYSTYEFSMKVISPFTATSISKAMFHDTEKLENIFWRYKAIILKDGVNKLHVDSCMCIQDPFEHNHNLTKCVNNTTIKHLQTCCTASALICRKAIDSQSIISLLPQLFKETPLTTNLPTQTSNYEITILPGSLIEQNTACSSNLINSEEHQRKIWYERVNEILMLILKKVMKFDISLTKCEQISKAQRTGQSTDVHDDIVESFKISCTGYYVLHSGRKKISKKIDKTTPSLKHEIAISEYILEKYYKTPIIDKKPILELDIEFMARRKPTRIVLEVINRQEKLKNYFIPCAQYLQRWLPSWMEKHLQENTEDIFTPTTS
ncbi:poly(A) RNA polymerase, mitochondrial-like [Chrysoperla carnea]|uniref:poly(A) RNA polymerase, mitochondrial-like n=1 Tax=Chrysoperla carnea TaxID=189513 RepID=UPI001D066398|nr:poly(A) RNA polymerase, mitochondrial-like [Chrysoperla carnea]